MEGVLAQLQWWQMALLIAAYVFYLFKVLGGGTRPKPVSTRRLLSIPAVFLVATWLAYDGMSGSQAAPILAITVAIAVAQGILLGNLKIIDCRNGEWRIYHGKAYLVAWVSFYLLKVLLTAAVVVFFGDGFHLWFGMLYFFIFSSLRSAISFARFKRKNLAAEQAASASI